MSDQNPLAQTRAIPRQMVGGILFLLAVMVVVAAIAVRLFPADHGPAVQIPTAPLQERIAPVGKVQIGTAETAPAAAAEAAPAAAAPATPAPAPAPAADKPAAKDSRAEMPAGGTVAAAAAPAASTAAPAVAAAPAAVATAAAAAASAGAAPVAAPAEAATAAAKAELPPMRINGRQVYQRTCTACHANGIAGAPRTGDIKAWGARIGVGTEALLASAINGKGAMPPRGGNARLTDGEVKAALEYMLNQFASR